METGIRGEAIPELAGVRGEDGDLAGSQSLLQQVDAQPHSHAGLEPVAPENRRIFHKKF